MARHRIFVGKDVHKFSAAHMTVFPDGTKEPLHGHNFQVRLEVSLAHIRAEGFLDFGLLKRALAEQCQAWDNRLLLAEKNPHYRLVRQDSGEHEFFLCGKRYVVPADETVVLPVENVVVESLAEAFARAYVARLGPALKRDVVESLEVSVAESE